MSRRPNRRDEIRDEDLIDEDGNLIKSPWTIKEEKRREALAEREKEREKKEKIRDLNRKAGIDKKQSEFAESYQKSLKEREIRDNWMSMPKWIKRMPRPSLSDPPTEGKMNMALYSMTKKVKLTEEEMAKRKAALKRLSKSMEVYKRIHQVFPGEKRTVVVSVIPLDKKAGASTAVRCISKCFSESRNDYGQYMSIDCGDDTNELMSKFKGATEKATSNMRSVLNFINSSNTDPLTPIDTFAPGGDCEWVLNNYSRSSRRADITISSLYTLVEYTKTIEGVAFLDCEANNNKVYLPAIAFSDINVFVLPISSDVDERMKEVVKGIRSISEDEEQFNKFIDNSFIIISGMNKKFNSPQGMKYMRSALDACSEVSGIKKENTFAIPFDKALSRSPIDWEKSSFAVKNSYRNLTAAIVEAVRKQ